uniref:Uncharacterized protein n=1 Tax=Parascaris univalens TaxID=6257 RepID=A0A915C4U4_PARUN
MGREATTITILCDLTSPRCIRRFYVAREPNGRFGSCHWTAIVIQIRLDEMKTLICAHSCHRVCLKRATG